MQLPQSGEQATKNTMVVSCWCFKAKCTAGRMSCVIRRANAQVHTQWTRPDWSSRQKAVTTTTVRKGGSLLTLMRNRKNDEISSSQMVLFSPGSICFCRSCLVSSAFETGRKPANCRARQPLCKARCYASRAVKERPGLLGMEGHQVRYPITGTRLSKRLHEALQPADWNIHSKGCSYEQ